MNYLYRFVIDERFRHDCADCVYLGSTDAYGDPSSNLIPFGGVDWYACKNTLDPCGLVIIGRWGEQPRENWSLDLATIKRFTAEEVKSMSIFFQTAFRLIQIGA